VEIESGTENQKNTKLYFQMRKRVGSKYNKSLQKRERI